MINYLTEMTHAEKVETYKMIDKDRLIEMLIEANRIIRNMSEIQQPTEYQINNKL
jgi:hypothetical protein